MDVILKKKVGSTSALARLIINNILRRMQKSQTQASPLGLPDIKNAFGSAPNLLLLRAIADLM
jgi:hypothetical protein